MCIHVSMYIWMGGASERKRGGGGGGGGVERSMYGPWMKKRRERGERVRVDEGIFTVFFPC